MLRRRLLRNTMVSFDPLKYGSCVLWLDANDYSTFTFNGGTISQWNDKSSNNNHVTQATAIKQPAYTLGGISNLPTITFDGTLSLMTNAVALTTATNWAAFAVVKFTNISTINHQLFTVGTASDGYGMTTNGNLTGNRGIIGNSVGFCEDGAATTNPEIWCWGRVASTLTFFLNGISQVLDVPATGINTPGANTSVGGRGAGVSFAGQLSQLIIFNRAFTAAEKANLSNEINTVYRLY